MNEKVNKYKKKYYEEEFQLQNKKFLNNLTLNNEPRPKEYYNEEMNCHKNSITYYISYYTTLPQKKQAKIV